MRSNVSGFAAEAKQREARDTMPRMKVIAVAPRARTLAAIAIGASLAAATCGDVTPVTVSAVKACMDLAQALCTKRASCTNGAGITRANGDMSTCVSREELMCTTALAAPDSGNSPTLVEKCVADYATYSCTDFLNGNPPADCVPAGKRAANAPCTFNGQCASAFCGRSKNANCGVCQPAPAARDSCAASNCGHDQACTAASMICATYGAAGDACGTDTPCGAGLNCMGASASATGMGTCQAAATTAGAACGAGTAGCDPAVGLFCGGVAGGKTCMLTTFVGDGAPCGLMSDGTRVACKAGNCYTSGRMAGEGEVGTCKAFAPDGSACDAMLGPPCMTPARCVPTGTGTAGTCSVPDATVCG
jgi:hypothetical protein